jgi:hypothetical protein
MEAAEGRLTQGGAGKNRKVDQVITLPAGNYKLRYKSDDSHRFRSAGMLCRRTSTFGELLFIRNSERSFVFR